MSAERELLPDYYRVLCSFLGTKFGDRVRTLFPSLPRGVRKNFTHFLDNTAYLYYDDRSEKFRGSGYGKAYLASAMWMFKKVFEQYEKEIKDGNNSSRDREDN